MTAVLEVSNLRKSFGGITAVDGVSFKVRDGEILGIIAVSYTHLDVYKRQT